MNAFYSMLRSFGVYQSLHSLFINYVPWHQWPEPWGLIPLAIHRDILEQNNLFVAPGVEIPAISKYMQTIGGENNYVEAQPTARPEDGYGTDIEHPAA